MLHELREEEQQFYTEKLPQIEEKLKQDEGIHAEYEFICKVLRGQEKNTVIADAFRGQELLIKAMQKVKES